MKRTIVFLALCTLGFTAADDDSKLADRQKALHVLNRLAFGPKPGDVDRLLATGIDVWIEQQLNPERIPDRVVDARLESYETLKMSSGELLQQYYVPVLQARRARAKEQEAKEKQGAPSEEMAPEMEKGADRGPRSPAQRAQRKVIEELTAQRIIRAAESERQFNEIMVDFWMNHFNVFAGKGIDRYLLTSYERDTVRTRMWGRFEDLLMATAKSPAMLWYLDNARSVAAPENRPKITAQGGRGGMRGGRGGTTARRRPRGTMPGMDPMGGETMQRRPQNANRGGLNENYAREIMELHTLGVDGGYTQKDVTELARVFTGWSIDNQRRSGEFIFRRALHDTGAKSVLGHKLPAGGGVEEGETMIRLLSKHPSTARNIAYKLSQRLVADEPPKALVDRVAKRFLETDGDLRQTVRAVIESPEFWDAKSYRAKVKSPFEYVISAVRAMGARVQNPLPIARELQKMGEGLYLAQPPTGYSDKAEAWVNSGALLHRLNFALALAAGKMPGVQGDVTKLIPAEDAAKSERSVDALAAALTGGDLSPSTRTTIKERLVARDAPEEDPWDNTQLPTVAGLILGSPEFQKQ